MELKPSYKGTDIGVIPEDWNLHRVGDVGIWLSGGTPSKSNRTYWGGDIPWVSPKDMKAPRLFDAIDHITPKAVSDGARLLPVGAILIVTRGMILAHSVPVARAERTLAFNQDIKSVVTVDWMDDQFLLYWLIANAQQLRHLTTDSTHGTKRLPTEMLFRALVPCPPLPEQRAIATALSDVDALLAKLDQLIAKKRDLKQAAMQQLLTGQIRLPGFSGEWVVKRLGDLATLYQPITISANEFADSGYPVYGANGVVGYYHDFNHSSWQVTVTCRGSTCGTVNRTVEKCWITGNAMVINCDQNKGIDKVFLYYVLTKEDLSVCITGTGQPQIVRRPLANVELSIPRNVIEQTAIATVLSDIDAEITALEARRDKSRALKQGMMQELLTGRIRLI